ncbi:MAG: ATP-binding protein [Phascolarctobacterium sp.]
MMQVDVLSQIHFIVTLIFGIILTASFLGVHKQNKALFKLGLFTVISTILQQLVYNHYANLDGLEYFLRFYPFYIHLPLIVFLVVAFRVPCYSAITAVTIAYACCQITKWLGFVGVLFIPDQWFYYLVRIALVPPVLVLITHYVSHYVAVLLHRPLKEVAIFSILPLTYYFFDYATTVYTTLLYSGNGLVVEFLGFMLSITCLIFFCMIAEEYLAKKELSQQNRLIELRMHSAVHELEQVRNAQYRMSIIRHDMRHVLSTATTLIQQQKYDEAVKYLSEGQRSLDSIRLQRFCSNEFVNAVLTKYDDQCKLNHVEFKTEVETAVLLPCPELCYSIMLDNALENAFEATKQLPMGERYIHLSLKQKNSKLLLSLKNTYATTPNFVDDVPVSSEAGHGIGTQSIIYNCNKLGGQCKFSLEHNLFVLQIIV